MPINRMSSETSGYIVLCRFPYYDDYNDDDWDYYDYNDDYAYDDEGWGDYFD